MINHLDQAHQQDQLDHDGNQVYQGIVFLLLVQLRLLFRNHTGVPVVFRFHRVDFRLEFHDLDAILMQPYAKRQQHNLG